MWKYDSEQLRRRAASAARPEPARPRQGERGEKGPGAGPRAGGGAGPGRSPEAAAPAPRPILSQPDELSRSAGGGSRGCRLPFCRPRPQEYSPELHVEDAKAEKHVTRGPGKRAASRRARPSIHRLSLKL
ncbi:translation initiation factor IF-2-like isoform X2 [Onychomys torridus]|uniref:translation initiation factor IF-2-like isoform X2 n=1 Tax=Onychomys torridus TaxID=38674 RepID=UPI00167F2C6C|nr:translation initiation factor IF-2-like isoform X2 [Onychomys torridus]